MKNLLTLFLLSVCMTAFGQATSPVQGDDLIQLLGKSKNSQMATKLNKFIGNKDPKADLSFLNYGKGIQVNFQRSVITGIDLYNDENPYSEEFKQFPGGLPFGLNFKSTIHQVKQKLGDDFTAEGEVSETYTLIKTYKLNDNDDYTATFQFNKGRMMMMSLMFIEGGGSGDEDDGAPGIITGFRPDDFFTMIKKNQYNREYKLFIDQLGRPDMHDRYRRVYVNHGVDVEFNKSELIASITLYSGGQTSPYQGEDYGPFELKLPFGIRMSNDKATIIKKVGNPASEDGSVITYHEGFVAFKISFKGNKINYLRFQLIEED